MHVFPYVGVDGCRGGWFSVMLGYEGQYGFSLIEDSETLSRIFLQGQQILIDIPIGLPEDPGDRDCDLQARRMLRGGRASSVFPVPCREAVYAGSYEEANRINRYRTGKGLSKQSWFITPKIREVDQLLQTHGQLRGKIRESHPELCFRALNRGMVMKHSKKTAPGQQERLAVLEHHLPQSEGLLSDALESYPRKKVAVDDIMDAMVLAVSSLLSGGRPLSLPENPPGDMCQFPMEIVYPSI